MKTARFFLCFVAMGALLMTGCKKDDEKDTPVAANDNEIVINNIRLPLESHIQTEGGVPRYMDCYQPAAEGEERAYRFIGDVSATNLTADLTSSNPGGLYFFSFDARDMDGFRQGYNPDGFSEANGLGDTEYPGQSIFTSGTLVIQTNDAGLLYKVDGVLKNGMYLSVKIVVPASEFVPVPWENER